jgi:type II secretory pathway pseudopilin PulG
MKRGLKLPGVSAGFTIVETMIVLAVTGLLFVSILVGWSGRQHHSEFISATQEIRSRIQQSISEVQAGYFPTNDQISCTATSAGNITIRHASVGQGENSGCVFLGKVMLFKMTRTQPELFRTYSLAGIRDVRPAAGETTIPIENARPTTISPDNSPRTTGLNGFDLSESGRLMYGLKTVAMKSGGQSLTAVGFLSRLGSTSTATGASGSGAMQVDLYGVGTNFAAVYDSATGASAIRNQLAAKNYKLNQPVQICFQSGGTDQQALVTIGADSSQLTTTLKIMPTNATTPCGI